MFLRRACGALALVLAFALGSPAAHGATTAPTAAPAPASVSVGDGSRAEPAGRSVLAWNHAKSGKRLAMFKGHNGTGGGWGVSPGYRSPGTIKSVLIPPGCFLMVNGYPVFGAYWNTGSITVSPVTVRAYCAW